MRTTTIGSSRPVKAIATFFLLIGFWPSSARNQSAAGHSGWQLCSRALVLLWTAALGPLNKAWMKVSILL